tara:strand:- start:767 stop:1180 length:414 start_codon:yes stop_codon:yes gene_type:complete
MKYNLSIKSDQNKFTIKAEYLKANGKEVELKAIRKSRTLSQNKYLHVCITLFAIEFGWTIEEAKTHLKRKCSFMVYQKKNESYLKRTRDMNTKELTDFVEWIRDFSALQGCYIPDPEEYKANQFEIDREIDKFNTYL